MTLKLGPHIQEITPNGILFAQSAPIVKQVSGTYALSQAHPGAITVYRQYYDLSAQNIWRNGADLANEIIATLRGFVPTYIELYNETAQYMASGLPRYVDLHWEAAPVIHAYGSKLAGYSFSTWGHPGEAEWAYMAQNGFGGVDAISIHEYWGTQGFTETNALYHQVLHRLNPNHPPFIISECGIDRIEGGGWGWKETVDAATYVQQLLSYDQIIGAQDYVLGATPFTLDANGAAGWGTFDYDDLIPQLLQIGPGAIQQRGRLPLAPILLFGVAGLLGTYAIAAAYLQEEEYEGLV